MCGEPSGPVVTALTHHHLQGHCRCLKHEEIHQAFQTAGSSVPFVVVVVVVVAKGECGDGNVEDWSDGCGVEDDPG